MTPPRVRIIPFLHDRITRDGKLSEPDIYDILQRWLERHPQIQTRQRDLQISRGRLTLPGGVRTELVDVTIAWAQDVAGYLPAEDIDLYEHYLSEDQGLRVPSSSLSDRLRLRNPDGEL